MDRRWWTLAAVCMGTFMLLLDLTVVNVALPAIQRSLQSTFSDLQWVIDAYTVTLAAFLLTAGVTGDIMGRRRIFVLGLSVFTVSSLVCGLSTSPLMLNLSRGFQGAGAAIIFATSLALIAQSFTGKEMGTAIGIYGAVIGGAVAVGPLVGGALTGGVGWRWIFFLNIPIGVIAVAITLLRVEPLKGPTGRHVDWAGCLTFSSSLFLLVYALVQGNPEGWGSPAIIGSLAAAGLLFAAFLIVELRLEDPMLDLRLFRRPAMVGVSLAAFALGASILAMFLYMILYLQDVLGYGPFEAGLRFLPVTVLAFLVSPVAGKLTWRVPVRYLLALGLGLIALGSFITHVNPSSPWTVLVAGFVLCGIGIGIANPVVAGATVSVVPPDRAGMASGVSNTSRQVGIATGVAALGAVYLSQVHQYTTSHLAITPVGRLILAHGGSQLSQAISGGDIRQAAAAVPSDAARRTLVHAYQAGFVGAFNHLLAIACVISLVGAVGSLVLVRQRDFVQGSMPVARASADEDERSDTPARTEVPAPVEAVPLAPVEAAPTEDATVRATAAGTSAARQPPMVHTGVRREATLRRDRP